MKKQTIITLFLILGFCISSFAQTKYKYLVLLKDKDNSPYSVNSPLVYLSQKAIDRRFR